MLATPSVQKRALNDCLAPPDYSAAFRTGRARHQREPRARVLRFESASSPPAHSWHTGGGCKFAGAQRALAASRARRRRLPSNWRRLQRGVQMRKALPTPMPARDLTHSYRPQAGKLSAHQTWPITCWRIRQLLCITAVRWPHAFCQNSPLTSRRHAFPTTAHSRCHHA